MRTAGNSLFFSVLQDRLIEQVKLRLFNGELTERRLARMIGVSQPHMHNVLKGVRSLTPEVADLLLGGLGISVLDLVETGEAGVLLRDRQYEKARPALAPVVDGRVGPGHPFPQLADRTEWIPLPAGLWRTRRRLVLAPMGPDPESPLPRGDDFALVCLDEEARLRAGPRDIVVLRWRGSGYARRVRAAGEEVEVLRQQNWLITGGPDRIELGGQSVLAVLRGVVVWTGRDFRRGSPLDYMGSFLENPASR